jgi:NADPH-dependent ferric siderophore reductase
VSTTAPAGPVELRTHLTEVVRAEQRTPRVRRITFGGGDLASFEPLAPDQFLYLLAPPPGRDELAVDRSFTWVGYYTMPEEDRPVGAYYTVRHHRPERAEIDVDVVLHADAGPASTWAAAAAPGDPVALWGPRTTFTPPSGVDSYLLVADETGLPGLAAIVESLPAGTPVRAVVEVADADERQPVDGAAEIDLTWLQRDGSEAGCTTLLADAVRAGGLPGATPYVWGGGESRAMTAVRRHLRHERGLPRERVSLTPFWRHAAHVGDPEDEEA